MRTLKSDLTSIQIIGKEDDTASFNVVVTSLCSSPVTHDILKYIYPALFKYPELADNLIGRPWTFIAKLILEFNNDNQAIRCDTDLDFLSGLTELVGDPIRAAKLMEEAMRDQCGIVYATHKILTEASFRQPRIEEIVEYGDQASPLSKERQSVEFRLS